jgi:hypothetical protein
LGSKLCVTAKQQLCLQTIKALEKDQHDVSPNDIKQYFEILSAQIKSILFAFVWNADETRVRCPKKTSSPEIIIAINTKPGSVIMFEVSDDMQFSLLTVISVFRTSTCPLFISKLKKFEKTLRAAQKLSASHDDVIRSTPKPFITEFLCIDWLENSSLPRIWELRIKFTYDGPSLLVLDGHLTRVTPRVIALCAA